MPSQKSSALSFDRRSEAPHELEERERALREREQLFAEVSHELRNSLNTVALATTALERRLGTSSHRVAVDRVARSARRALAIVQNVLSNDTIESGRLALGHSVFEPAELVLEAVEAQKDAGAAASVVISADLTPSLPSIRADRERLLEVLDNLIGNALKFTKPSGTIGVGAGLRAGRVVFWVKDSGIGIRSDQLGRIFEKYWRARPKESGGTGLGLNICKGIVEAHGGRIWAESAEDIGTTILFTIPEYEAASGTQSSAPVKILVVDDRAENRLALETILEQPGYEIVCAGSGQDALRSALVHDFSVVLLDIDMPDMDGFEVVSHLKLVERTRSIPVVFVTAYDGGPEQIHRAYSAGGADYLVKPLDPEVVRRKVAVFAELGRRRTT